MIGNYIKIALRNLVNNKGYAFINIFGLAIGLTFTLLIGLYIKDELSYDKHNEDAENIYRITSVLNMNGTSDIAVTSMAVGPTMVQDFPEVEQYVRFFGGRQETDIEVNEQRFREPNFWLTDSTVFDVFTYQFIAGDKEALKAPNSIVLTKKMADKLFGSTDIIGQDVKLNNSILKVTGVIENPPKQSEIPINAMVSMSTMPTRGQQAFNRDWFRVTFFTFVKTASPLNINEFEQKLAEFDKKHVQPWSEANDIIASHSYEVTPLLDVHFDNTHEYDLPKGNKSYVYIFSGLAVLLLIIAAINYVNLALAQYSKRSKEVGIRKTLGASKQAIMFQFLIESICIALIALVFAFGFAELLLAPFNELSGKEIGNLELLTPSIIGIGLIITLGIGVLAGSYPSFVISRLNPNTILKGNGSPVAKIGAVRKTLVLTQFVFSLFMIIGTLYIGNQMNYLRNKNLGFDKENLISIRFPADTAARRSVQVFREQASQLPGIQAISNTQIPTAQSAEILYRIELEGELVEKSVKTIFADDKFLDVLGLDLIEGRNFSPERPTDRQTAFVINEAAAKKFGWTEKPLGKRIQWGLEANNQATNDGQVVGIIPDFHFMSLHNPLEPLIMVYNPFGGNRITVRFEKGDYTNTLDDLTELWAEFLPGYLFDYSFFDRELQANYAGEERTFKLFTYFSIGSLLISGLGLLALLSYSIASRRKQIAIRKVLGAQTHHLAWFVLREFIFLLVFAYLIVIAISPLLFNKWNTQFAYLAPFSVQPYIVSLLTAIILLGIAVTYHTIVVSKTKAIRYLKEE